MNFINSFVLSLFHLQGDYIKHPVLYELSHKYGFTDNIPESALPNRLEEIKETIRREIRKELKVRIFFFLNFQLMMQRLCVLLTPKSGNKKINLFLDLRK